MYSRRKQKEKPLSIYIRSLAVADTFMIISCCGIWLRHIFQCQMSQLTCKVENYVTHCIFNVCEYIIVAITLSRLIAIMCPMRAANTKTRPKVLVATIVVVSCLVNLYHIWTREYSVHMSKHTKTITYICISGQQNNVNAFVMLSKSAVCFIIPMFVIFVANLFIIRELKKRKRSQTVRRENDRKEGNKVTIMLVVMTCVFLVLLLPYIAYRCYTYFNNGAIPNQLIWAVCEKLLYSNNAVNFYVYALTVQCF